ncbi:hypothetical protein ABPG75_003705 [Micractinium tetrahymenae]
MFGSQTDRGGPGPRPTAVEVHSLPADVSLRQLRDLISQGSPGQVLQCIAALDSSEQGVALIILSSEASAARVVELFDGYPLGGAYLHVKRADSLPGSLVNLLYSLEQASPEPGGLGAGRDALFEPGGRAGSSVSSGSPRPTARSTGRRSDDKPSRPGGQDGASPEPTTKLWMGGIDGTASAETVRAVFGRFGPIYDYELQPATHEKGRTDQWGFVNFKRLGDATRAYQALVGEVIPELTGTRKLKLQFRPVDSRRSATGAGSRR